MTGFISVWGPTIFAATLAGLLTFLVTLYFNARRRIFIDIDTSGDLVKINTPDVVQVELKVDGQSVENLYRTVIEFRNVGNRSIETIKTTCETTTSSPILSVNMIGENANQEGLNTGFTLNDSSFRVHFDYLNSGEKVAVEILTTGTKPKWTVPLRIKNVRVSTVEKNRVVKVLEISNLLVSGAASLVAAVAVSVGLPALFGSS